MSPDNVEILRRMYEAWANGDLSAGAADLDTHVVFVIRPPFLDPGTYHGPDGCAGIHESLPRAVEALHHRSPSISKRPATPSWSAFTSAGKARRAESRATFARS